MTVLRKTIVCAAAALLAPLALTPLWAQTLPGLINFQGRLTDPSNNPLSGPHNLYFELYDQSMAGVRLWSETQAGVLAVNGVVAAQLGNDVPIPAGVFRGDAVYLQVTVDGDVLTPRQRLITSPYSFNSYMLAGREYGAFVSTDSAAQTIAGDKTFTGSLSVTGGRFVSPGWTLQGDIAISTEGAAGEGGGIRVSTNVYIVGFSSAARYFGDGSGLYNVPAASLGIGAINAAALIVDGVIPLSKLVY